MFIIKTIPEASAVTLGIMSVGCLVLGKYGKHIFIKKIGVPFWRRVLAWISGAAMGVILSILMRKLGVY